MKTVGRTGRRLLVTCGGIVVSLFICLCLGHVERPQAFARPQYYTVHDRAPVGFMMLSAYGLEPYNDDYIDNALLDLSRQHIAGIVYASLGKISSTLQAKGYGFDENELNRKIFARARRFGTAIWLQIRVYDNRLYMPGEHQDRNFTAEEILTRPQVQTAFLAYVRRDFETYNASFADRCRVVVFEEAGIYHSPQGGGYFWSSSLDRTKHSAELDEIFVNRLSRLYLLIDKAIKRINPGCSVGMHLGHSVFESRKDLVGAIDFLTRNGARPNFILYDLYLKAQRSLASFSQHLTERIEFIHRQLMLPAYYLAQLHTMNAFQNGFGRTPSRSELDKVVTLSHELKVDGFGFYTKNAVPTVANDNTALDPNVIGQATVYESSRDRWDFGLAEISHYMHSAMSRRFDIVLQTSDTPTAKIEIYNYKNKRWDVLGRLMESSRGKAPNTMIFRALDRDAYLSLNNAVRLRIANQAATVSGIWLLATQSPATFATSREILSEIRESGKPAHEFASFTGTAAVRNILTADQ